MIILYICRQIHYMSGKRISGDIVSTIIDLHSKGKTNREIGKLVGVHRNSVGDHLKKNNLISNGRKLQPIDKIDDFNARCSKCYRIKPILEFQKGRRDKQYEYHFSYCNKCRKSQIYLNLNSDINKFLSEKYNRLKLRASSLNLPCELTKQDIIDLYIKQRGMCFYTDKKMICNVGKGYNRMAISIDKIIPEKGYIIGNTVLCTVQANTMKCDLTINEIQKWMPLFYEKVVEMWRQIGLTCLQVAEGNF